MIGSNNRDYVKYQDDYPSIYYILTSSTKRHNSLQNFLNVLTHTGKIVLTFT